MSETAIISPAARSASSTPSTTSVCCSSRATGSRRSTSSCRPRSRTRAACSPGSRPSGSRRRADVVPNHLLALRADGRSTECRRLEMLPIECVVRGYLAGSGWKDYLATGEVCGHRLPRRPASSRDRLPEPIFTPATKAQTGHDENIDREPQPSRWSARSASTRSSGSRSSCTGSSPSTRASAGSSSPTRSSSSASTAEGALVLGDEAFTPDSSRFWPADEYAPGGAPALVRQAVRPRLLRVARLGQDLSRPRAARRRRRGHARALRRGVRASDRDRVRRRTSPIPRSCSDEGDRARPSEAGDPRPAGPGGRELRCATSASPSARRASAGSSSSSSRPTTPPRHAPGRADVRAAAREPPDRELRDRARRRPAADAPPSLTTCAPRDRRRRLPGLERRPRRAARPRAARRDAASRLARRRRSCRAAPRPSSSPAGSRTATTSAAARSPASRRSWCRRRASPPSGGLVLGICNGFQILTEAGLLPGALPPERVALVRLPGRPARRSSGRTRRSPRAARPGQELTIPVKHGDGCWFADAGPARRARGERPDPASATRAGENPNGAVADVAGVCNEDGQRLRADAPPRARGRSAARLDRRRADPRLARRRGSVVARGARLGTTTPPITGRLRSQPERVAQSSGVSARAAVLAARSRSRARSVTGPRRPTPSVV